MTRPMLLDALLLAGCSTPESAGTSVGNPGSFALTAGPGEGVNVGGGTIGVSRLAVKGCDGSEEVLAQDQEVDLGTGFDVTAGTWCTVELVPNDDLVVEFTVDDNPGEEYELVLTVASLTVGPASGGFTVAEDGAFVFELGNQGWIDIADLEFDEDDQLVEDEDLVETLEGVVADESALYEDADTDGALDDTERNAGAVATPTTDEDDDDGDGEAAACGAAAEDGEAVALLLFALPLGLRRRRT